MNLRKIIREELEKIFQEDFDLISEGFWDITPPKKEITKYTIGGTGVMNTPKFNAPSGGYRYSSTDDFKPIAQKRKYQKKKIKEDDQGLDNPLGGTIADIGTMIQTDVDRMEDLVKFQNVNLKNDKASIKADMQKKNAISSTVEDNIPNPDKRSLDALLRGKQQVEKSKEKTAKELEKMQTDMEAAKEELDKQAIKIEKQSKEAKTSGTGEKTAPASVLPSLPSAI